MSHWPVCNLAFFLFTIFMSEIVWCGFERLTRGVDNSFRSGGAEDRGREIFALPRLLLHDCTPIL